MQPGYTGPDFQTPFCVLAARIQAQGHPEREGICPWSPLSFHSLSAQSQREESYFMERGCLRPTLASLASRKLRRTSLFRSQFSSLAALVRGPPPRVVALVFLFMD